MDKIIIHDARFLCTIGVSARERKKKQEVFVDVTLFITTGRVAQTDNIENTVSYSEVYASIANVVESREYKLIETMAEYIAKDILHTFPVEKILVRLKKPMALANRNVKYVAIEIMREKHG